MAEILTLKELANNIDIEQSTLRTYLDGFRFAKYRTKGEKKAGCYKTLAYKCNMDFWENFMRFLVIKGNLKYMENVKKYLDSLEAKE